ncbi:Npun_R2479 family HD domain-containing metalloprotein [Leptolyngbya sp. FACHB-261]|uniref:Npun_R2479 family HD domain-containing metalloprotein n=1 Tax=Leptolyngbya sp. FACHB-261 TaxID=2692806 RepID=UPI0018F054E2|nr:Npun_R2479 family HD domain-containing metalloprotein [Leptolyngbya sp. FACHB-261]
MLNTTEVLIHNFVDQLKDGYRRNYGNLKRDYEDIIGWVGVMALEYIANSDALYHNVDHTILVTLVGQEILRGKHIRDGQVSCEDWLNFIVSLICHDIGYVKGVCRGDTENEYVTGLNGDQLKLPPGASDAALQPVHVDRGKLFVEERFGSHLLVKEGVINVDAIKTNIELTRFPVPSAEDHQDTCSYPGLVRAADLIGQLSDPRYLTKINALFYEFEEIGVNQEQGYRNPDELRQGYPNFYRAKAYPYLRDALDYLALTQQGRQITANLDFNLHRAKDRVTLSFGGPLGSVYGSALGSSQV